jgi:homotetrameric cytidine deaminase
MTQMKTNDLLQNSYVPYSEEPGAAVVRSKNGALFGGTRIENISFPLTISAVQNALFCCLSEGHQPEMLFISGHGRPDPTLTYWLKAYELEIGTWDAISGEILHPVLQPLENKTIIDELSRLFDRALVEYSDFPVSALIETSAGFISGVNIETGDWGKGLCAERIALAKAVSCGHTDFKALHISTRFGEYNSPCGACRQVILEHLPCHPVYLYHADGTQAKLFSSDLLPYSFQSSTLQKNPNHDYS